MKKQFIAFMLVALMSVGATSFVSYGIGKANPAPMTIKSITEKMTQDNQKIVIKKGLSVLYVGSPKDVTNKLSSMTVTEIANCDDDFAITVFVR